MLIFIKKFVIALFGIFFTMGIAFAQKEIIGTEAPDNFAWTAPKDSETSFKLISLDSKPRAFYVQKDGLFVPVQVRGRSFSRLFSSSDNGEVVFFRKLPLADGGDAKRAKFVAELTINTKKSKDVIIGLYSAGNSVKAGVVDVSLSAMPIGSFTIVSFNPGNLGFRVNKKVFVLSFFQTHQQTAETSKRQLVEFPFETYNLKTKPPSLLNHRRVSFWSTERLIVFAFSVEEVTRSMGSLSGDMGLETESASTSSGSQSLLVITNQGPR